MAEVLLAGRIVAGHPMKDQNRYDDNGVKIVKDGKEVTQRYISLAIPKNGSTDWKQTDWGRVFYAEGTNAVNGYKNGEDQHPSFSWKVTDGDSTIPNKRGKKPCDQPGQPGNWIVSIATEIPYGCYHVGKYDPMQAIQNPDEITCGDNVRVMVDVKPNRRKDGSAAKTPGIYVNPRLLELSSKGEPIVTEASGPSAAAVFGGGASPAPVSTPAPVASTGVTPPPATDLLVTPPPVAPVEEKYNVNGTVYTKAQLLAMPGWTVEHLANLPRA